MPDETPNEKPTKSKRPENGWKEPLWERQEGEGARAFQAFTAYRDLGPARSLSIVAGELGKSTVMIGRWSSAWGWVERSQGWDDFSDRNDRERDATERARNRQRMLDSHARGGSRLHAIGQAVLDRFDPMVADPEAAKMAKRNIEELTAAEAARLMEIGAKMERLARGESSERIDVGEARVFVEGLVDLCLGYLPLDSHEAFLASIDERLGIGGFGA